jgi:hypothetical protein
MSYSHCHRPKKAGLETFEKTSWNVRGKRLASSHGIDP